jgi:hypothetical protein
VSVDQVNNGRQIEASASVASFTVAHRARSARTAANVLAFTIDDDPLPIRVPMAATADSQGAVRGALAADDATRLFAAVGAGSFVTLTLEFAEREPESLRFHFVRDTTGPAQGVFAELCRPQAAAR